jgi:hypothetical protein
MKWVFPSYPDISATYWICHGFDGEGCDYRVEEKYMDWAVVNAETFRFRSGGLTMESE